MDQHCWNVGYDHATSTDPDPIGDGLDAFPCTLSEDAAKSYGDGYITGMSAGESDSSSSFPNGQDFNETSFSEKSKTEIQHLLLNDFNSYLLKTINVKISKISPTFIKTNSSRECNQFINGYSFVFIKNGNFSPCLNCYIVHGKNSCLVLDSDKWKVYNENALKICHSICVPGYFQSNMKLKDYYSEFKNIIEKWLS